MIDLHLRADTRAAMIAGLDFARRGEGGEAELARAGTGWTLDPIGPLVKAPALYDPHTGEEREAAVIDRRYHANLRARADIAASVPPSLVIQPSQPARRWA